MPTPFESGQIFRNLAQVPLVGPALAGWYAIADPNYDVIPGVGANEKSRANVASTSKAPFMIAKPNYDPAAASGPVDDSWGGGGGGGGGGSRSYVTANAPDTAAVSYWDDQIGSLQRLLNSSNTQRDQGLQGLGDSYKRTLGDLTEDQARAKRDYGLKREQTQTDRQSALRTIDSGARNGFNGLQRLFQLAGSAGSSAAKVLAPDAVARDASMKRTGTLDTFGRNSRAIDISEADANSQFARNRRDLDIQKREKERSFIEGILNVQNDLNAKLGNAVTQRGIAQGGSYGDLAGARAQYDAAIRSNQSALDNLFNQYRDPQFKSQAVNLQAPALSQYTVDGSRIDAAAANPGIPDELLPYLAALKDKEQQSLLA